MPPYTCLANFPGSTRLLGFLHCQFEPLQVKLPIGIAAELSWGAHVEVLPLTTMYKASSTVRGRVPATHSLVS